MNAIRNTIPARRWTACRPFLLVLAIIAIVLGGRTETARSEEAPPIAPPALKYAVNPIDDAIMVWVPAGAFRMGVSEEEIAEMLQERTDYQRAMFEDEVPQHEVELDGYWIYIHEVTVAQYTRFCEATKRTLPEIPAWATADHPITNVTWHDAMAYARWAKAELPSEAQWEKAARGVDARRFPWGNVWDVKKCNNFSNASPLARGEHGQQGSPVGSFPAGASPYGVHDMAGNVWEWCRDWYAEDYYAASPKKNPEGPQKGEFRVMRGGSWGSSSKTSRVTARLSQHPEDTMHDCGGFRCVVTSGKVKETPLAP